ncbi:MAG: S8 family serine peptidase [Bacteroidota bacterium]|nr:S8 family serine peptidase [Bacteroidota bacterium]
MKQSIIWRIGRTALVLTFSLYSLILFSQERNLKSEILVFFMPDSLELPVQAKNRVALTNATIKSKQLSVAVQKTKPIGIAKAFPDWQIGSKVNEGNKDIEAPQFDRIFILTFNTEAEADAAINILSKTNGVVFAEKHSQPTMDNDVHYINGDQWYLNNNGANGGIAGADINAEGAWAIYTGNTNNTIAIIDNGVEITHEDLSGKASGDTPVGYSHGTRVAGVAAARANNALGIRGVDWNAQILSKRVKDSYDNWLGDNVAAQKIVDAVNEGADVLNCSWSSTVNSSTLAVAFAYAYRANRITVATMGNTGVQETRYPGAFPNVMAVGATQNDDTHSPYSTTGTHIDVVAPGGINPEGFTNEEDIITTTTNNNYEYTSGTSFAAPQVAGLASLLEGYNSNLDNDDIRQIIRLSADDRGDVGFDNTYGFGRINAGRALEFLQAPNTLNQWAASGGTVFSSTDTYTAQFIGAPGLSTANYLVKRYEVRKTVTFPDNFLCVEGVWGRGVFTSGCNLASPNFGEGFCEVVEGTQTNTSVTLRTNVYEIWSISGSYLGYYPQSPSNVSFAYSVLGILAPTISGPSLVCTSGSTYTLMGLPFGLTGTWTCTSTNNNLTINPTTGYAYATSSTSGQGTISAIINTGCGNITLPAKTVWVGSYSSSNYPITGPSSASCRQYVYYSIPTLEGVTSINWIWPSGWTYVSGQNTPNLALQTGTTGSGGTVAVQAVACGSPGSYATKYTSVTGICGYSLSVSPNPTSVETTIELVNEDPEKQASAVEWELEVFDQSQVQKTKIPKIKDTKYKLNTTGWKDGVYIIRAKIGDDYISEKLVVKH